jgi:hypothetical protein
LSEPLGEGANHLLAILGPLPLQHFGLDAAHLPVQQGNFGVDGHRSALLGGINELPNVLK